MSRNLVSRNLQPIFSTELRRHVAWQELFASTYGTMVGIRKRGSRNRDGKDLMILAIIHNKGGTGKTTSAINRPAGLAMKGHRALLADRDSQASASRSLEIERAAFTPSVADAILDG